MNIITRQPYGIVVGVVTSGECRRSAERGATLFVALMFMLILTIFGVTAVTTSTLQEKMSANLKDQQMAFQSAETALREAEARLGSLTEPPPVITGALVDGSNAVWPQTAVDLTASSFDHQWWDDNAYTATPDPYSKGAFYVIEERGQVPLTNVIGIGPERTTIYYYRVSAYGAGVTGLSSSVAQATFVRLF
ncbi:MAG TPA: PilX N-terminal domain-containing pilus assembly protein [Acidiferrobacterales bacterium]|jgi:type IV pilus assembly protein PilX